MDHNLIRKWLKEKFWSIVSKIKSEMGFNSDIDRNLTA